MNLGRSQINVLKWLKDHSHSKAQDVGDALYASNSSCVNIAGNRESKNPGIHDRTKERVIRVLGIVKTIFEKDSTVAAE